MAGENKVDETTQNVAMAGAEGVTGGAAAAAAAVKRPKNHKKLGITLGVICAVVIVAGAGFAVWHEQPSFCNAICHAPQDPINETYDGVSGQSGYDKWGNAVEDMGDLLVVQHKEAAGATCLSCHVATLGQQITEGTHWVSGSYEYPLNERSLEDLNAYVQADDPAQFCLNESCHNMTRDDLADATSAMGEYNPHVTEARHTELQCSDCHKAHRQSVMACTQCHSDATVPDGWLSSEQAAQITSENFRY